MFDHLLHWIVRRKKLKTRSKHVIICACFLHFHFSIINLQFLTYCARFAQPPSKCSPDFALASLLNCYYFLLSSRYVCIRAGLRLAAQRGCTRVGLGFVSWEGGADGRGRVLERGRSRRRDVGCRQRVKYLINCQHSIVGSPRIVAILVKNPTKSETIEF